MRKILSLMLLLTILPISNIFATPRLDTAINRASSYIARTTPNPTVNSVGGEWAVIGLHLADRPVPASYYTNLANLLRETNGILSTNRYTEYSRVALALTITGQNPRDFAGFNLLLPLSNFERVTSQGINGAIWALIALDSGNYPIITDNTVPTQATRLLYINDILRRQTRDGGFNLLAGINGNVASSEVGDVDITAMAIIALSNYQNRREVAVATNRALRLLSNLQEEGGGYGNLESTAQVLTAISSLGIDLNDERFVKNGNTLLDYILLHQSRDGGFRHKISDTANNQMSTEQALYSLIALRMAQNGEGSIFR